MKLVNFSYSHPLRARERALTPCSFAIFCLGFTFESLKELGALQLLFYFAKQAQFYGIKLRWYSEHLEERIWEEF
jgi:hypothetical protein